MKNYEERHEEAAQAWLFMDGIKPQMPALPQWQFVL